MLLYKHDNYSWLNHRIGDRDRLQAPLQAITWVPDDEQRRLAAYTVCSAVLDNVSRYYLRGKPGAPSFRENRAQKGVRSGQSLGH